MSKEIVSHFAKAYSEKMGESYIVSWGRDVKIFSELQKSLPITEIKALIDHYFTMPEKRFSPVFFRNMINDLRQLVAAHKPRKKLINPDADRFQ